MIKESRHGVKLMFLRKGERFFFPVQLVNFLTEKTQVGCGYGSLTKMN